MILNTFYLSGFFSFQAISQSTFLTGTREIHLHQIYFLCITLQCFFVSEHLPFKNILNL